MAIKKRVCKSCGHFCDEDKCEVCGCVSFALRHKGRVTIFDDESIVAKKLEIKNKGMFAIKYN